MDKGREGDPGVNFLIFHDSGMVKAIFSINNIKEGHGFHPVRLQGDASAAAPAMRIRSRHRRL